MRAGAHSSAEDTLGPQLVAKAESASVDAVDDQGRGQRCVRALCGYVCVYIYMYIYIYMYVYDVYTVNIFMYIYIYIRT